MFSKTYIIFTFPALIYHYYYSRSKFLSTYIISNYQNAHVTEIKVNTCFHLIKAILISCIILVLIDFSCSREKIISL